MDEVRSERGDLINEVVEMLLHHVTVTDPHTLIALREMQITHFVEMPLDILSSINSRLHSYTDDLRRDAAVLLTTAERDTSPSYSDWVSGSVKSALSALKVRNCVFVVPVLKAAGIPVQSIGTGFTRSLNFVAGPWESASNDEFLGWALWHAVTSADNESPTKEHAAWLGSNADALLTFMPRLLELRSADRKVCEVFLNGHKSLSSGVL